MSQSSSRVVAGEVTRAVQAERLGRGPIAEGDYLGLSRSGIEVVAGDLAEAATGLLERLLDPEHHEMVTVITGEGSGPADTRRITEWLAEHHPGVRPRSSTAGNRFTLTCSASSERPDARQYLECQVTSLPRSWPSIEVERLNGVGPKHRDALARRMGIATRARPADPLPPPLHRPHQPVRRSPTWSRARRRWSWPRFAKSSGRRTRQGRSDRGGRSSSTGRAT